MNVWLYGRRDYFVKPMHTRTTALFWTGRMLLISGVVLGLSSLLLVAEARFFERLPVPSAVTRLPGEQPESFARPGIVSSRSALEPGSWLARLDAPDVSLSATVLEGSDDATLARAAGHIEETALPGEHGNVGIAGHRDTTFRPLRHLKLGDILTITTAERVLEYRVASFAIVSPDDVYVLDPTGRPTLTLVTCYPFTFLGHAPQRFIVQAELREDRPR